MSEPDPLERLESMLFDTDGVYVNAGADEEAYFAASRDDIRRHVCAPFHGGAVVTQPGFPDFPVWATISGSVWHTTLDTGSSMKLNGQVSMFLGD